MSLKGGRRVSDGSGLETASSLSSAERNKRGWINDVFFDTTDGGNDDQQQDYVALYFQKLSQFGNPCLSQSTDNEDLHVMGSSCES